MILDKQISIILTGKMYQYYKFKGYDISNKNIIVDINDLSISSHILVNVKCDYCGKKRKMEYRQYIKSKIKYNKYSCSDCSKYKNDITNLKKYGFKKPLQNKKIKQKQEKTCVERYGVVNVFQSNLIKEKIKNNTLKKYGVEYNSQRKDILYKMKQTNIERYGTTSPLHNPIILEKVNKTNLEKYGYIHPMKNKLIKEKLKNTNIKKGYIVASNDFDNYKNNVRKVTRQCKEELFDKWDGNDFYDNEYIKENMLLHPNDKNYPTIDHKISILHGFLNKISPFIIGNVKNLCITKRSINSSKSRKTIDEFKKEYRINEKSFSS